MADHEFDESDFLTAAEDTANRPLDHFPPLVAYRCLGGATAEMAQAAAAASRTNDLWMATETIAMPRKGAGPRPVAVLSPVARTLYTGLVSLLAPALADSSRAPGRWDAHRSFGRQGDHTHVVDVDYASCYETVDHRLLERELLLRSMDTRTVGALMRLLDETEGSRGLPQMLHASDLLADTFLSMIDRRLERDGLDIHRYADDIRILTRTWVDANQVLEDVAVFAREAGLILAATKTGIRLRESVERQERASEDFQARHLREAEIDLENLVDIPSIYGLADIDAATFGEHEKLAVAGVRILDEWHVHAAEDRSDRHGQVPAPERSTAGAHPDGLLPSLSRALQWAAQAPAPVSGGLLEELVFQYPLRLDVVCQYLLARTRTNSTEAVEHQATLQRLTQMGRQSPWAKLWMLHTAHEVTFLSPDVDGLLEWTAVQTRDPHELVRAQAAWTLANWYELDAAELSDLYRDATPLTHPALAAAAARQSGMPNRVVQAIRSETPLNEKAFQWGV